MSSQQHVDSVQTGLKLEGEGLLHPSQPRLAYDGVLEQQQSCLAD